MNPQATFTFGRALRLGLLCLGALMFLAPYVFMLSTAGKGQSEIFTSSLSLIPQHSFFLQNFMKAFTRVNMLGLLFNGVVVCCLILFFQVLIAVPCAYALAKLNFRARKADDGACYAGPAGPHSRDSASTLCGLQQSGGAQQLHRARRALSISVFGIFLFLQFFRAMPDDLIHAARLDGMSEMGIVARVIVPNAWPAITAFAIFSVVAHWNDLYWPLIVVSNQTYATPPLGLLYFRAAEAGDDYGALMAATLIITLPLVLAFLFAQKRFVEALP